jgi:CheY-like chemotaxis protein
MIKDISTILVVDDDKSCGESLKELLKLSLPGTVVITADSGKIAINLAKELVFNLVIFDGNMPGINGPECYDAICEFYKGEQRKKPKGILVSGNPDAFKYEAEKRNIPFVSKPLSKEEILDVTSATSRIYQ